MYAKAIIPADGPVPIDTPIFIITLPPGSELPLQLHAQGWHPYGGKLENIDGEIQIMPDAITVIVSGQTVLRDDTDSVSPPGWWEAVDAIGGRAVAVFLPAGSPLGEPSFPDFLIGLIDDPRTAQAFLLVKHR